jgi:hypothetical protein
MTNAFNFNIFHPDCLARFFEKFADKWIFIDYLSTRSALSTLQ